MKKAAPRSILVVVILLVVRVMADAQQLTKVQWIGYLTGASLSSQSTNHEAFQQGLRELGYVEGKNIAIEASCRRKSRPLACPRQR